MGEKQYLNEDQLQDSKTCSTYGKQAGCVMQGSTSLKDRGTNTLYGTSWAMFRKSCYPEQGSAWGILRHALNWGLILLSLPSRDRQQRGHRARAWGSVEDKQQVQGNDRREHATFSHINGCHFQKCPCCRRLRRWWSVVHTQSNPRSAWKRQYSRVRACDQRDNAGRHWCERVLPKACCRNSHCEGLYHFLCEMGFDLAKDQAHRAPCELLRQLMYQSHLKPSAKTPHNPTLCDEPYSFVWITQELLKLGHSEILPYRNCIDSWKIGK